jgi:hypothetical protein
MGLVSNVFSWWREGNEHFHANRNVLTSQALAIYVPIFIVHLIILLLIVFRLPEK